MAELKTKASKASVTDFLKKVSDPQRKKDSLELLKIFKEVTPLKPVMWGSSIVGFGNYYYESKRSSQKGDWFYAGFSPRKQALTLYIMSLNKDYGDLLQKLGPHKTGVCCLYIKKLEDIDKKVLKTILKKGFKDSRKIYG